MERRYSVVACCGELEGNKCGYCRKPDTSYNYGMWIHAITVQDYQALIDRGWRRSGCYCYKPTMDQTCCPMYTIKCEALNFKISKSQKKVLKKMGKFLRNELRKEDTMDTSEDCQADVDIGEIPNYSKYQQKAEQIASEIEVKSVNEEVSKVLELGAKSEERKNEDSEIRRKKSKSATEREKSNDDASCLKSESAQPVEMDPGRAPRKKARLLRKERKQNKLLAQGRTQEEVDAVFKEKKRENREKSLEELFDEMCGDNDRLKLKLVRTSPMSSEYLKTSKQSFEVYKKYQTTIHEVPAEKVTETQYTKFLVKSPLQIKLVGVTSDEFNDTLDASAELYKKYQMAVHKELEDECTKMTFINFLVKSNLQPWTPEDGPPKGYGAFHEQYWLDDKLIAVGVMDILPYCVSSVYFFYDPAYSHLSLGTFSSLREVYLTRQLNKVAKSLKYYYMGFYLHACAKMRYKARMKPSKLLCPETYQWFDIEKCLPKLDKQKYSRLNDDLDAIDQDGVIDVNKVFVLHHTIAMPYRIYKARALRRITEEEEEEVRTYATLVGMKCAQRLLLYRC